MRVYIEVIVTISVKVASADNCNCRNKEACPLQNKCMNKDIVYKATISTSNANDTISVVARALIGGGGCIFIYSCYARLILKSVVIRINLKKKLVGHNTNI